MHIQIVGITAAYLEAGGCNLISAVVLRPDTEEYHLQVRFSELYSDLHGVTIWEERLMVVYATSDV